MRYTEAWIGIDCSARRNGRLGVSFAQEMGERKRLVCEIVQPVIWANSQRALRLPQLTYADDHPGEDLPRFRFVFEVTAGDARARVGQ